MEATQPHSLFSLLHPHNSSLERRELKRRAPASPSHRTVVKSGLAERLYGLHLVKQPLNFKLKCFILTTTVPVNVIAKCNKKRWSIFLKNTMYSEAKKFKIENSSKCMTCKEGKFEVVELMIFTLFKAFYYQFECSRCGWNDSFG